MDDRLLGELGFLVGFEGETEIQDGAKYLLVPKMREKVPEELSVLALSPNLYFITNSACHGFYTQFPILRAVFPSLEKLQFGGRKVTIVRDSEKRNNSLFESVVRDELKTGSIEGDVTKLFREQIVPRGGVPAGFVRMVHSVYENASPHAGKLVGALYEDGKLGAETPLDQYIDLIK